MGWPRKNEVLRLYLERKQRSYLLVLIANGRDRGGIYDVIANVHPGPYPSLCGTSVSASYLLNHCRRVEWSELPREWQRAFMPWLAYDQLKPKEVRGLWRITS